MALSDDIQKLYIAYFNRPADPAGLAFWIEQTTKNGGNTAAIANAFSGTAEYQANYAGLSSVDIVNKVYQNLFGRTAEPAGLQFWTALLDAGALSVSNIVTAVFGGAQNSDSVALSNKSEAAALFTASLKTPEQIAAYSTPAAAELAAKWLSGATTPEGLQSALIGMTTVIGTIVTGTPPVVVPGGSDGPVDTAIYVRAGGTYEGVEGRDDVFKSTIDDLVGSKIRGNEGDIDTLTLTTAGWVGLHDEAGADIRNIKVVNLADGTNVLGYDSSWGFTTLNGGAGDDTMWIGVTDGGITLSGGGGIDTVETDAFTAAAASMTNDFAAYVTGFEILRIIDVADEMIDLGILGNYNHVNLEGYWDGLELRNLPSNGTVGLFGSGVSLKISSEALSGGDDVIKLVLRNGLNEAQAFASAGIDAAGVEAVNIRMQDRADTPTGEDSDSLRWLGNNLQSVTISGNRGLVLEASSSALANVDASGLELGGFAWTAGAVSSPLTVKGTLKAANDVDLRSVTAAATYTGGEGVDTLNIKNHFANVVELGDGNDTLRLTVTEDAISSGTYRGGEGDDTLFYDFEILDFSNAEVSGFEHLVMPRVSELKLKAEQFAQLTSFTTNSEPLSVHVTLTTSGTATALPSIRHYNLGDGTNIFNGIDGMPGRMHVYGGAGNDTYNFTSTQLVFVWSLSDRGGTDVLNVESVSTAGVSLSNAENIETINVFGTKSPTQIAMPYGAGIVVNFTSGPEATHVNFNSGGQTLNLFGNGNTTIFSFNWADTINLNATGTGKDALSLFTGGGPRTIDTVTGFNVDDDVFRTGVNALSLVDIPIASAEPADLISEITTALGSQLIAKSQAFRILVESGDAAGTYFFQNTGSNVNAVDDTDFLVKVGTLGGTTPVSHSIFVV